MYITFKLILFHQKRKRKNFLIITVNFFLLKYISLIRINKILCSITYFTIYIFLLILL